MNYLRHKIVPMDKIKEKFKNHELTKVLSTDNLKVFEFRNKNGEYLFYQRWIIDRGTLIVQGDCFDAIYRWNEGNVTLPFLATCGIGYFSEKCRADKDGQMQKTFNSSRAENYIKQIATERILENSNEFDDVEWEKLDSEKRFELVVPIIMRELGIEECEVESVFACENVFEGYEILNKKEHWFMFGSDGWEYGSGLETLTMTPKFHLAALKVAYDKYQDAF